MEDMMFKITVHTITIGLLFSALAYGYAAAADTQYVTLSQLRKDYPDLVSNAQLKIFKDSLDTQGRFVNAFKGFITEGHNMLAVNEQLEEAEGVFFVDSRSPDDKRCICTFHSPEAIAWVMRYFSTFYTCTRRGSSLQERQEAKQLTDTCQYDNNKEIQTALAYFKQRINAIEAESILQEKQNAVQDEHAAFNKKFDDSSYKNFITRHEQTLHALLLLRNHFIRWNKVLLDADQHNISVTYHDGYRVANPARQILVTNLAKFGPKTDTYKDIQQAIDNYKKAEYIHQIRKLLDNKFAPKSVTTKPKQGAMSLDPSWTTHLNNSTKKTQKQPDKGKKQHKRPTRPQPEAQTQNPSTSCTSSAPQQQAKPKKLPVEPLKPRSQDGSYTEYENDILVNINDPKNHVRLTLFKVSEPQNQFSHPTYTSNVTAWFENVERALEMQGYNDPQNPKHKLHDTAPLVHSFARVADTYLTQCGVQSTIINNKNREHIAITIPGLTIDQNEQEEYGLFTYFIDKKNGQWYHRNFVRKSKDEVYTEYMRDKSYSVAPPTLVND